MAVVDDDPTDRGLPWLPPDDEGEERLPRPRLPVDPGPSGPPASEGTREEARADLARRLGRPRTQSLARLMEPCRTCKAAPRDWCRGRVGFIHPSRGSGGAPGHPRG